MTARELFGVATRVIGLLLLVSSIADFLRVLFLTVGIPMHLTAGYTIGSLLTAGIYQAIFGLILMFGASAITRLVYGRGNSN